MPTGTELKSNITWRRQLSIGSTLQLSPECGIALAPCPRKSRSRRAMAERGVTFRPVARSKQRVVVRSCVSISLVANPGAHAMGVTVLRRRMPKVSSLTARLAIQ